MSGRLRRCGRFSRRDWPARAIFLGARKYFRTESRCVVLSGFPTALEPVLLRLSLVTNVSPLPFDRRAGQLLVPRDDIPPPSVIVLLGICRLRLARTYGSFALRLRSRCSMGRPERILSWWDQEVDRKGRQIRSDVRSAGHQVWKEACRRTQSLLADPAPAPELMEDCVAQVSRYLDRIGAPSSSPKNGLLLLAFSRSLRRLAAKSRRLELAGGAVDLSSRTVDRDWSRQLDARLDLENIVRRLSERNSTVLALRAAGYHWKEVAQALGTSVATVRNSFWREVRDVRRKLQVDEPQKHRIDHRMSQGRAKAAQPEET